MPQKKEKDFTTSSSLIALNTLPKGEIYKRLAMIKNNASIDRVRASIIISLAKLAAGKEDSNGLAIFLIPCTPRVSHFSLMATYLKISATPIVTIAK